MIKNLKCGQVSSITQAMYGQLHCSGETTSVKDGMPMIIIDEEVMTERETTEEMMIGMGVI